MKFKIFCPFLILLGAGCNSKAPDAPREELQKAVKNEAKDAEKSFSGLSGSVVKNGELQGGDAQGRPLWKLAAREIRASGDLSGGAPKSATLLDASATLFRAGSEEIVLRAQKIQMFQTPAGLRLQLGGKVVAKSRSLIGAPVEIMAPRADVDVAKRLISASGGVVARREKIEVRGPNLRAQTSLSRADFPSGASVQTLDGKIDSKSAIVDWKTRKLSAKTVVATRQNTVLRGQLLNADGIFERGILSGNVVLSAQNGAAKAPRVDFDWKRDRIFAQNASFAGEGAILKAASLRTDSNLHVADATNFEIRKNGAILRAQSAQGFDKLNRLKAQNVVLTRADIEISATSADATNWDSKAPKIVASGGVLARRDGVTVRANRAIWTGNAQNGVLEASENVRLQSPRGNVRADRAIWRGNARKGQISATGNVILSADSSNVSGQKLQSDAKFENAILSGEVRGKLRDGTTLRAPKIEKIGEKFVASSGASAILPSKTGFGSVEMRAARVEISNNGQIARATGGVRLKSQSGATASAPSAIYNRKTGKITASGGVQFSDPARGLRQSGESLVADLGLKSAEILNVQGQGTKIFEGQSLFD